MALLRLLLLLLMLILQSGLWMRVLL